MRSEKELEKELKQTTKEITKKTNSLKAAEAAHAQAEALFQAQPTVYNEAGVVMAHSDIVNLRAELFLLQQRQDLYTKQLEYIREQAGPVNG